MQQSGFALKCRLFSAYVAPELGGRGELSRIQTSFQNSKLARRETCAEIKWNGVNEYADR
jgi:hypothetical protein